jgi:RNA polymerase sigma-70 factor (ECF subfamily)
VDEAEAMTTVPARELLPSPAPAPVEEDWVALLRGAGPAYDDAVRRLHDLMLRATRHQLARMPAAARWDAQLREETAQTAADEATVAVLGRLSAFEGRSRFTTWAFKFGILHASVEVRRLEWRHRVVSLESVPEPASPRGDPSRQAEGAAFARAVESAICRVLTDHQRRVAVALIIDGVPIDVLAERLGSNRNAIYKTLHDARVRLRAELARTGYLDHREA